MLKLTSSCSVRNSDPVLCPHGALGQHLMMRFTLGDEPFPDVEDRAVWNAVPLWPGENINQSLSYQAQAKGLKAYLRGKLKIYIKKVTHAFRVFGARRLDESGCRDEVSADQSVFAYKLCIILMQCLRFPSECLRCEIAAH